MARVGEAQRTTKETRVTVRVELDGSGRAEIRTGVGMYDHLLEQVGKHGLIDITITAEGDLPRDAHHTVEDVALALGLAFREALGDAAGVQRFGHALVPMDEALALVAVDLSGRGYAAVDVSFSGERVGEMPTALVRHALWSFAQAAKITLHARLLAGVDDHHRAEALFKGLGRALRAAAALDERAPGQVPSTKGKL